MAKRMATWRGTTFGPASEEPYRRRVPDAVRVVAAVLLLAVLGAHATSQPSATERALFQFFNSLPAGLQTLCRALYGVGTAWAVGLAIAAAVVGRRWRLARDLLLAGMAAWAIAHVLGAYVLGSTLSASLKAVTHVRAGSPHFPFARLAIVTAVVATAGPYLTRPTRRVGQVLLVVLALSALYLGSALPNDLLGGLVLGWGVAAAVHFGFGSPGGRPTAAQVTAVLTELGVDAAGIHLAARQPPDGTLMLGHDEVGPLRVRVIGRDQADAQFLAKVWRFLFYKHSGPTLYLTRLQQVEHEAYLTLVARDHGVRTPDIIVAGQGGPKTAVLVERDPECPTLAELDASAITDDLLAETWRHVGRLHAAHVAHGDLDTSHVLVDSVGPMIVGFGAGSTLSARRTDLDVVGLLVSSSAIVGAERAVGCAVEGVGVDAVERALPFLQPAALTRAVRAAARSTHLKRTLDGLRTTAAGAAGVEPPELLELHHVSPTNLILAVGTLVGVGALLSQVGSPSKLWATVQHANWAWLAIALALSLATNITFAVALMGTVPLRLPLWPTTEVQLSMSFSNLAIPGIGGTAEQIRFLQKQGINLASAIAAGGLLSTVANLVVSLGLFAVAVALSPHTFTAASISVGGMMRIVLLLVAGAGVAAAVILGIPRLRRVTLPPVKEATSTLAAVLRSPRQLFLLIGGFAASDLLYAVCLLACLKAFNAELSLWTLLGISVLIGTLASIVPIPGGGGALASVGMSGAIAGFGVATSPAVAAVLVNTLVVSYLPAIPGWFATERLIKRDYL